LNLFAFGNPNAFERFIRECYLNPGEQPEIQIVTIGWISPNPNPYQSLAGQAGPLGALYLQPNWIPKVYLGLIATANDPPPITMTALQSFRNARQYRAMMGARIRFVLDGRTGEPIGAEVSDVIIDGGWTPPFDRNRFLLSYGGAITRDSGRNALNEPSYQPGTASIASAVLTRRHPNSALSLPPGERLLANGLIRFRAGKHTDDVGVAIGSPYHVPWVWNEFAVTYGQGHINVYGTASAFPTTWWYVNGHRVKCQPRLADSSFPMTSWNAINTGALRVYPAISIGASAQGGNPQTPDDKPAGVIYRQPYTVGPPSTGGGTDQWHYVLGDPPPPSPAVSACGSG
jgi:hypothetical protein